jgi:hypothetical protein
MEKGSACSMVADALGMTERRRFGPSGSSLGWIDAVPFNSAFLGGSVFQHAGVIGVLTRYREKGRKS